MRVNVLSNYGLQLRWHANANRTVAFEFIGPVFAVRSLHVLVKCYFDKWYICMCYENCSNSGVYFVGTHTYLYINNSTSAEYCFSFGDSIYRFPALLYAIRRYNILVRMHENRTK